MDPCVLKLLVELDRERASRRNVSICRLYVYRGDMSWWLEGSLKRSKCDGVIIACPQNSKGQVC